MINVGSQVQVKNIQAHRIGGAIYPNRRGVVAEISRFDGFAYVDLAATRRAKARRVFIALDHLVEVEE